MLWSELSERQQNAIIRIASASFDGRTPEQDDLELFDQEVQDAYTKEQE